MIRPSEPGRNAHACRRSAPRWDGVGPFTLSKIQGWAILLLWMRREPFIAKRVSRSQVEAIAELVVVSLSLYKARTINSLSSSGSGAAPTKRMPGRGDVLVGTPGLSWGQRDIAISFPGSAGVPPALGKGEERARCPRSQERRPLARFSPRINAGCPRDQWASAGFRSTADTRLGGASNGISRRSGRELS